MSSPWAKIDKPEVLNLQEIMSEQIAADIAKKEQKKLLGNVSHEIPPEVLEALKDEAGCLENYDIPEELYAFLKADETVESDAEIARTLQAQFDREHDEELMRCENKFNGGSKVSISYRNFMRSFETYYDEQPVETPEPKNWDRFETMDKEIGAMPLCGYKMMDGVIVTKHDATINGRNNARKLLSFPPEFQTGDGENIDLQLSNQVYNRLKVHSQNSQYSKRHKIRDKREDRSTTMFGLDEHTHLQLYKMVNGSQILDDVGGVISIGKEAAIFHAFSHSENGEGPKECAIKVFKTSLSEFKDREKYIRSDHRFKDRIGKQTSRKTVHIWAEKEMANLCRLKKAGIPCPEVFYLKECILVMSFIGENRIPADKLKEATLSTDEYIIAYDQVTTLMKTLFWDAKLIHADLSEYNILWHKGQCYFIDVSQSVEPVHENAFNFLYRDCENITNFFQRKSVPGVVSSNELFKSITGYYYEDKEQLLKLQTAEKPKPHTMDRLHEETDDNFDRVWNNLKIYNDIAEKETTLVESSKA
ncbi:serine/threonine-protein kinase RIO3 isoform X2 [Coccinella septempunctata]|uniref:serine/threonine-protein kinase RIO3 isoform X2 n=1 Tax=Coccinella septempunctata TaxID=41139 RepID=UPI001D0917F4|nr:serine/threonine-protein kinase RIO3 isoform X2 [Coccinella septempunctata]